MYLCSQNYLNETQNERYNNKNRWSGDYRATCV